MVSSMRSLKKNQMFVKTAKIALLCTLTLTVFSNKLVFSNDVNVNLANVYVENDFFYLDSTCEFFLTEEANKALHQGISFEVHKEFQLLLQRKWFWNKIIFEKKLMYKLEHKPLTENFLITDLSTGIVSYYKNLDAALKRISKISKMKLFNQKKLDEDRKYLARIRLYLDIDSLPSPLRPRAYISSDWNISSNWYKWEL